MSRATIFCVLAGAIATPGMWAEETAPLGWKKARALRAGDTIMFVAPAAPVKAEAVKPYAQRLEKAGFKVMVPANLERSANYLAGTDEERATELNQAFRDPKVNAIFACRGGYGLTRILDKLDYEALRKNPKIVTGFSDLTGLHLAIARKARVVSFHSPLVMTSLVKPGSEYTFALNSFSRAVFAEQYTQKSLGYTIDIPKGHEVKSLTKGKARGRLLGGNLSLICATMGTPFEIEPDGAILFFEDVNEAPYRVDRFLSQLRLAKVFEKVAGIVVGNFNVKDTKESQEIDRVVREYLQGLKVPIMTNFPVGHLTNNATLPHGTLVELDADRKTLALLEDPVER